MAPTASSKACESRERRDVAEHSTESIPDSIKCLGGGEGGRSKASGKTFFYLNFRTTLKTNTSSTKGLVKAEDIARSRVGIDHFCARRVRGLKAHRVQTVEDGFNLHRESWKRMCKAYVFVALGVLNDPRLKIALVKATGCTSSFGVVHTASIRAQNSFL